MILSADSLFGSTGLPLRVRDAIARAPSGPVTVDAVKVVLTVSGWSEVRSENDAMVLTEGTILVIPPGLECSGHPAVDTRTVTFYVHEEYLADQVKWLHPVHPLVHQMQRALLGDPRLRKVVLPAATMHILAPKLGQLARLPHHADDELKMLAATTAVFDAVGRFAGLPTRNAGGTGPVAARPREEISAGIALLRDHLACPWQMSDLANELALSVSQLSRLFRSQLGISPAAYLWRLRAARMAELLTAGDMSVSEATRTVGWPDLAVGSRAFKRRYGVSPREYAAFHRRYLEQNTRIHPAHDP